MLSQQTAVNLQKEATLLGEFLQRGVRQNRKNKKQYCLEFFHT